MIASTPRFCVAAITLLTHPSLLVSIASCAPSERKASAFAGDRVVAITGLHPRWRAIWIAAVPTPDGPAVTITASPGLTAAAVTIASCAVIKTLGMQAASTNDTPSGIPINARWFGAVYSAQHP